MPQQYQTVDVMSPMANIGQSVKSAFSNVGQGISAGIGVVQNQKSREQIRADYEKTKGEIEGKYGVIVGNLPAPKFDEKPEDYDARNKLYLAKKLVDEGMKKNLNKDQFTAMLRTAGMNEVDPMFDGAQEQGERNSFMKDPMVQQRTQPAQQLPTPPVSPMDSMYPDPMQGSLGFSQETNPNSQVPPSKLSALDEMARLTIESVKNGTMHPKDGYKGLKDVEMEKFKIEKRKLDLELEDKRLERQRDNNSAREMKDWRTKNAIEDRQRKELVSTRAANAPANGKIIGYDSDGDPVYGQQGQKLSQNTVKTLSEASNFPKYISDLRTAISTNKEVMGPVSGRISTFAGKNLGIVNKSTRMAQDLNSKYEAIKQVIAKAMEGGVLRKEDMPKYEKILGSIALQPEFAEQNLASLETMLTGAYDKHVSGLEGSGYFVPDQLKIGGKEKVSGVDETNNDQGSAQISPKDQQAIDWAKSNPDDPRAKKILSMHGM